MKKIFLMIPLLAIIILTLASCAPYDRNMIKTGVYTKEDLSETNPTVDVTAVALTLNRYTDKIEQCTFDMISLSANNEAGTVTPISPISENEKEQSDFTLLAKSAASLFVGKSFAEVEEMAVPDTEEFISNANAFEDCKKAVKMAESNPYHTPRRETATARRSASR